MIKKIKVNLVEDDKVITVLIKNLFSKRKNVQFKSFLSAEDCLKKVDENKPDVIIVDYNLGGEGDLMTGLDFIKKLKQKNNKSRLIFHTGNNDNDLYLKAIQAGVFEYIVKDEKTSMSRLLNSVSHLAKIKKLNQEKRNSQIAMTGLALVLAGIIAVALIFGM